MVLLLAMNEKEPSLLQALTHSKIVFLVWGQMNRKRIITNVFIPPYVLKHHLHEKLYIFFSLNS